MLGSGKGKASKLNLNERVIIEEKLKENFSSYMIARMLNRHKNTVKNEILRNGGKLEYNALKADRRAKKIQILCSTDSAVKEQKKKLENKEKIVAMFNKIDALEMHIHMIYDMIENIKKENKSD